MMHGGWATPSRWGIKGTEDPGSGYKVGFKLESGLNADDGSLKFDDRLFGCEAGLTLYGPFGSIAFGRFGGIISSLAGTYDLLAYVDAFDGGDGDIWGLAASSHYDNMAVYQTPRAAGLQLTAQYSFKTDSKASDSDAKRRTSLGLCGEYGPAQFAVGCELTKYGASEAGGRQLENDDHLIFIGGSYDFEVVKVFAEAQFFKGQ